MFPGGDGHVGYCKRSFGKVGKLNSFCLALAAPFDCMTNVQKLNGITKAQVLFSNPPLPKPLLFSVGFC